MAVRDVDAEYLVVAVLKNERTAHVYGPFSHDQAVSVKYTLDTDLLLELESCTIQQVDADVSIVPKAQMKLDRKPHSCQHCDGDNRDPCWEYD